jgi:hypothetical protein
MEACKTSFDMFPLNPPLVTTQLVMLAAGSSEIFPLQFVKLSSYNQVSELTCFKGKGSKSPVYLTVMSNNNYAVTRKLNV